REKRVLPHLLPRPAAAVHGVPADPHQRSAERHLGDDPAGDGTGGHAHGGLAGAGASAAAIVAHAVLLPVGEVGVAGAELVLDVVVVPAALVDIVDDEGDGRARGDLPAVLVGERARENAHRVGLAPLG